VSSPISWRSQHIWLGRPLNSKPLVCLVPSDSGILSLGVRDGDDRPSTAEEAVRAFVAEHPSLEDALGRISTVAQLATLAETDTGRRLVVGNTHLFYHPQAVHVRILQAHQLLSHAHRTVHAEASRRCAAVAAAAHVLHLPIDRVYVHRCESKSSRGLELCKSAVAAVGSSRQQRTGSVGSVRPPLLCAYVIPGLGLQPDVSHGCKAAC
jgi:hypothetical protein